MKVVLILILSFITEKTFAYTPKEGNVSAIFGPYLYKTDFSDPDSGVTSPYFGDLGLIAVGDVNKTGSLEIAMFHMNKLYVRESVGRYLAEKTQVMHITMGYRHWWTESISTSLAFYSAYSMGKLKVVHNDFPLDQMIDTSASDTTEYGFDFAIQKEFWSREQTALVVDARYAHSVTSKEHEKGNHYGIMIGMRYFVQGK